MKCKTFSTLIIISLIATNLSACNLNINNQNIIGPDTPYYSVTIGHFEKSNNTYMNIDVEMPKITYSNDSASALIDSINTEIEKNLNDVIEESKNKALSTYEAYIESAKTNAKKDIENRINNLKEKYKNVLGDEEVKLISEFTVDDLERMPFGRRFIATDSNFRGFFPRRFNYNKEETIHGFTNTNDIINPNLHNKNIIVIETTTKDSNETTIEGKDRQSNIEQSEGGNRPFNRDNGFGNSDGKKFKGRGTRSNADRPAYPNRNANGDKNTNEDKITNIDRNKNESNGFESKAITKISTNSEIINNDILDSEKDTLGLINDEINVADINEEITLENFYRDFRRIYMSRIPDDYTLAMYYIPTTIKCNFEVKCLDKDYISLFVEVSESRTTTQIKRLFYNVDINKGKILNIKDFLGENYKDNTIKVINSEIDKWSDDQKATLINNYDVEKYINDETPYFINNNHRAVVQIEKFAITIGSAGYHEFQIP